ncbi:MAG: ubiquitin fusion degradation UFD1 family protein [Nitrososphaerales archaeon]
MADRIYSRLPDHLKVKTAVQKNIPTLKRRPMISGQFYAMDIKQSPLLPDVKQRLQSGGRVILPDQLLGKLLDSNVEGPYTFEISNPQIGLSMVVGVEEFGRDPIVYLPTWMMRQLDLEGFPQVLVENVSVPKGTFAHFKADSRVFDLLPEKEAFLERQLRNFTVLNVGDIIPMTSEGKSFRLEVIKLKPADNVMIIDTDLEFDFEPSEESKIVEEEQRETERKRKEEENRRKEEENRRIESKKVKFDFGGGKAPAAVTGFGGLSFSKPVETKPVAPGQKLGGGTGTGRSRLLG